MPQRVLLKSKPWVFIPDNTLLQDDDALIDQQLRRESRFRTAHTNTQRPAPDETMDMANTEPVDDLADLVNEVVFKGGSNPKKAIPGRGKRKRPDASVVEEAPKKRAKKGTADMAQGATTPSNSTETTPAKRGRPKKTEKETVITKEPPATPTAGEKHNTRRVGRSVAQGSPTSAKTPPGKLKPRKSIPEVRRHMLERYPAVAPIRKIRNVYDEIPESPESKSKTKVDAEKSKHLLQPKGGKNLRGRRIKNIPASKGSTTAIEGHSSAIFNGRVGSGGQPQGEARKTRGRGESTEAARTIIPIIEEMSVRGKATQRPNQSKKRAGKVPRQTRASEREQSKLAPSEADRSADIEGSDEGEDQVEAENEVSADERSSQAHNDDSGNDNGVDGEDDSDNDEEDQQNLDLLGEEENWKKVLDAARSICGPRLLANRMPTFLTAAIKDLVLHIQEARDVYQQLLSFAGTDHDQIDGLRGRAKKSLQAIEELIDDEDISEGKAFTKRSELIQDTYKGAIPALVLLLKDAFAFHAQSPKRLYDYETLKEIVLLQDMIVAICEKAVSWKAKPLTNQPIMNPTRRVIFPFVRNMRNNAFKDELARQRRRWKIRKNAVAIAKRDAEQSQQRRDTQRSTTPPPGAITEDLRQSRLQWRGERDVSKPRAKQENADVQFKQPPPQIVKPRTGTGWTDKENRVLIRQLQLGYIPDQPCAYCSHLYPREFARANP